MLSGTLTVYGDDGRAQVYAQGQAFGAGWERYRAVNETAGRVETRVTFHRP